jgi:hypothetical protein
MLVFVPLGRGEERVWRGLKTLSGCGVQAEKMWTSLGNVISPLENRRVNQTHHDVSYTYRAGSVIQQYSYGIKFAFSSSGEVNKFSFVMLITALSTATVLMGQVGLIMSFIAFNTCESPSPLPPSAHKRPQRTTHAITCRCVR